MYFRLISVLCTDVTDETKETFVILTVRKADELTSCTPGYQSVPKMNSSRKHTWNNIHLVLRRTDI